MSYLICKRLLSNYVLTSLCRVFSVRSKSTSSVVTAFGTNSAPGTCLSHRSVSHIFSNYFRSRNTSLYCITTTSLICAVWNLGRFFRTSTFGLSKELRIFDTCHLRLIEKVLPWTLAACDLSGVSHCMHSAWNTCGKGFDHVIPASHPLPFSPFIRRPMSVLFTVEGSTDDVFSFIKGTGRAYNNQAIALIGLYRLFSQISNQRKVEHVELRT